MKKTLLEKIVSEPAKILDEGVRVGEQFEKKILSKGPLQKTAKYLHTLGPGLVTGAADDDPSGIATYSQAGAQFGFRFAWLSFLTFPLMAFVQEMCARIGLVTGQGLAANIRSHFPRWLLYSLTGLVVAANTFNIAADLGAMAEATKLIVPEASFILLILFFALISLALQIFTTYVQYAKYLKYLTFVLFSYVAVAFFVAVDWHSVFLHIIHPTIRFTKDEILIVCAILGTTISPYLFFWQSSQEVEEEILHGKTTVVSRRQSVTPDIIGSMRLDVWSGMFISNAVMFFIIVSCAATLHQQGITTIATAAQAAQALKPLAGNFAFILFTIGIVGTGMLGIPVLAGASSYAVAETLRWKFGLYRKLRDAHAFYGTIILGMLLGIALNFVGIDPIRMLIYAAIVNGLVSPVVLASIILLASNKKIMGLWVSAPWVTVIGWVTTGIMALAGLGAIVVLFF